VGSPPHRDGLRACVCVWGALALATWAAASAGGVVRPRLASAAAAGAVSGLSFMAAWCCTPICTPTALSWPSADGRSAAVFRSWRCYRGAGGKRRTA